MSSCCSAAHQLVWNVNPMAYRVTFDPWPATGWGDFYWTGPEPDGGFAFETYDVVDYVRGDYGDAPYSVQPLGPCQSILWGQGGHRSDVARPPGDGAG